MKITDCLAIDRIVDLDCGKKDQALEQLIRVTCTSPAVLDCQDFRSAIIKREQILSTGLGLGLAVPHAKIESVTSMVISLARHRQGLDFDSLDGNPVNVIVMIGANKDDQQGYLNILAEVSSFFKEADFRERFMKAEGPEDIYRLFFRGETNG